MNIMKCIKEFSILHLDGGAGLTVGILLLVFYQWISDLYNLSTAVILVLALANIGYGIFGLSLAFTKKRTVRLIAVLAIANVIWMFVCIAIVLRYFQIATYIGLIFILIEGACVFILACYEWKNRHTLAQASGA